MGKFAVALLRSLGNIGIDTNRAEHRTTTAENMADTSVWLVLWGTVLGCISNLQLCEQSEFTLVWAEAKLNSVSRCAHQAAPEPHIK